MHQITLGDMAEESNGAPTDAGRLSLLKAGLAASILALWQPDPVWALENEMSKETKNPTLPAF